MVGLGEVQEVGEMEWMFVCMCMHADAHIHAYLLREREIHSH